VRPLCERYARHDLALGRGIAFQLVSDQHTRCAFLLLQQFAQQAAAHELFQKKKVRFTQSHGNFVFFDSGRPHLGVASALAAKGIDIGRRYPPLGTWIRISIGLPEENTIACQAVAELLTS